LKLEAILSITIGVPFVSIHDRYAVIPMVSLSYLCEISDLTHFNEKACTIVSRTYKDQCIFKTSFCFK